LLQDDNNYQAGDLLNLALAKSLQKTVIKRAKNSPFFNNLPPHYQLKGQANRFDIFITKKDTNE
jgi:hypothetical protein